MTKPKKALGQNFLMHARIAERIADASGVTPEDTVLEIGPGTGKLTRALLARARRVIAVETDADLIPELQNAFANEIDAGKLVLIHKDIRVFDPTSCGLQSAGYTLVANIPYYITGEIIRQFLTAPQAPRSMTLLVQKEVAERVARAKKESLLSLSVKTYGVPRYMFTIPRGAFVPAPNVDSAVLSIADIRNPFASPQEEEWFFRVLHAGFAHKRKLLSGNLSVLSALTEVREALVEAGVPLNARAEDVPLSAWRTLAEKLR